MFQSNASVESCGQGEILACQNRRERGAKIVLPRWGEPRVEPPPCPRKLGVFTRAQFAPGGDCCAVGLGFDSGGKSRGRRGQIVQISQAILDGLDDGIDPCFEGFVERACQDLDGVTEFLAADAKPVQGRGISVRRGSGGEELVDTAFELPARPGSEPRSARGQGGTSFPGALEKAGDSVLEAVIAPEPLVSRDDLGLRRGTLGSGVFQPMAHRALGCSRLEPRDQYVAIAGLVRRMANPPKLLPEPLRAIGRQERLKKVERCLRAAAPDAKLVDMLGIAVCLLSSERQKVDERGESSLKRAHRHVDRAVARQNSLDPFLARHGFHRPTPHRAGAPLLAAGWVRLVSAP